MKVLNTILLTSLILWTQSASGQSFREKVRERVKERMAKKVADKPAPALDVIDGKITRPGDYTQSMENNNLTRLYKIHIPKNYNPETPAPLLVALHGGGGDMELQSNDESYKLISKSDKEGFIVLFPNGFSKFKSGKFATWNAGKCCGGARDNKIEDVDFIRQLIKKVSTQVSINQSKIFATGMSNGGMMSYRLACEMSDVFKAIAAVAGTDNTIDCDPKKPVSILHIHASNDDHVLYNGGAGKGLANNKEQVADFVSVPETVSKWVKMNECDDKPKRVLEIPGAHCDLYSSCKNKTEVKLCVTDTGMHSWPGGEKKRGAEPTSKAISANDMMWDFFVSK